MRSPQLISTCLCVVVACLAVTLAAAFTAGLSGQQKVSPQATGKPSTQITTVAPLKSSQPTTSTTTSTTSTTSVRPRSGIASLVTAASISTGAGSLVDRKSLTGSSASSVSPNEFDGFDGKNPFADNSLWQIPISLVHELTEPSKPSSSNLLASSATSTAPSKHNVDLDDDDAEEMEALEPSSGVQLRQQSSSAPTVISASTDLKTAAGYHYPSHGGGYGHQDHHHHHHHPHHHDDHYNHNKYKPDHHDNYGHGKYFQYASVPYPYTWEAGYRRGNPYHTIERHEHAKGPHFKTKVKWSDKHAGYGVHVWDYNHDDHHSYHNYPSGHHDEGHYDKSHGPSHHYDQH